MSAEPHKLSDIFNYSANKALEDAKHRNNRYTENMCSDYLNHIRQAAFGEGKYYMFDVPSLVFEKCGPLFETLGYHGHSDSNGKYRRICWDKCSNAGKIGI